MSKILTWQIPSFWDVRCQNSKCEMSIFLISKILILIIFNKISDSWCMWRSRVNRSPRLKMTDHLILILFLAVNPFRLPMFKFNQVLPTVWSETNQKWSKKLAPYIQISPRALGIQFGSRARRYNISRARRSVKYDRKNTSDGFSFVLYYRIYRKILYEKSRNSLTKSFYCFFVSVFSIQST